MLRPLVIISLFFYSVSGFSNTNVQLNNATILEFLQTFSKGVYKQDYVISPELYNNNKKVTINLNNKTDHQLKSLFETMLTDFKISKRVIDGSLYFSELDKLPQPTIQNLIPSIQPSPVFSTENQTNSNDLDLITSTQSINEVEVYSPKHRSVIELSEILQLFKIQSHVKNSEFLIYTADDKTINSVKSLLEKIDVPQNQYEVIAATYEYTTSDDSQRSINVIGEIFKNLSITLATAGSSNVLTFTGGSLLSAFKFFDTDSRFRSISKPYARVKSGGKLSFTSGQDVPTLGNITTNNNVTQQSVEYRKSGVLLDVELNAVQDSIDLKITHELSNFTLTKTGVNNSPTLNKRTLKTDLNMRDSEIIVIGGVNDLQFSKSNSSLLGISPIEQIKASKQSETLIFLQVKKI